MPVMTIRGQLGSGAPEIGRLVAAQLNIDYIDREVLADVAAKLQYPEQKIAQQEMPPATLLQRIRDALEHSYPPVSGGSGVAMPMVYFSPSDIPLDDKSYLAGLESVIKQLAAGKSIVIRGRGSQFILKNHPGVFHVLTVAPLETRIARVRENLNVDEKKAKQEIEYFDSSRREFIKRYFKADLEDPLNYDLVVNTGYLEYKDAAAIIVNAVTK